MSGKRIALIQNNVVVNVIIYDGDINQLNLENGIIAIENDWVGPGDWWEASEGRFYRALPNNDDSEPTP